MKTLPLVHPRRRPDPRAAAWLIAIVALAAAALAAHGPIAQWSDYHAFADRRAWLGIANAGDVLSNGPFLAVGVWACWRLRDDAAASAPAWRTVALALIGTAIGSTLYHLAPDDAALVFDRLPIACACAGLACAFLAERLDPRCGRELALASALAVAVASVLWWSVSGRLAGVGDLRPYLFVQALPMLLVPVGLLLRLAPLARSAASARGWWTALALYALAKLLEIEDRVVFDASGWISGHTLKHLAAAAGAAALLASRIANGREPAASP